MALKTTLEQLEEVQAAISKVLEAQSVSQADTSIMRASLAALEAREQALLLRYKREQGGGWAINIGVPRRG